MSTNEERRNVARNLRNEVIKGNYFNVDEICSAIGLDPNELKDGWEGNMKAWLTLHDLIEPEPERTCEIVTDDIDRAHCSLCGYEYDYHDGTGIGCMGDVEEYEFEYDGNYCKNCGAKVINNANE